MQFYFNLINSFFTYPEDDLVSKTFWVFFLTFFSLVNRTYYKKNINFKVYEKEPTIKTSVNKKMYWVSGS